MNEIEKPETKRDIEEVEKIFEPADLEHKNNLRRSMFYLQLFRSKKLFNIYVNRESEIFEQAENDFNKLKLLFQSENWNRDIPESIIKECFKVLKQEKKKKLNDELDLLKNIFKIEGF